MNCARGACGIEVRDFYRIWNLGTDEYVSGLLCEVIMRSLEMN